jgi:RND superfamily putative drug exporter
MNRLIVSPRWQLFVFAVWIIIALAAFSRAARINQDLETIPRLQGSESAAVDSALQHRFKSPFTKIALLHMTGGPDPQTAPGRVVLKEVTDLIENTPGVEGVMSYGDRADRLFVGLDLSSIIVVGLTASDKSGEPLLRSLRVTTDTLHDRLIEQFPKVEFRWTGEAAVNADMRKQSAEATRTAELRVLPITLLLLLLAFRSVISAFLPILCGALTILVSLGALAMLNQIVPVSIIVVSIISMIGLGLSIDYALLMVSDYRDALSQGTGREAALIEASTESGRTILVSGAAVAIGFAAMSLVPISEVQSIGMGGLLVTAVAVLVARTLLPVALLWLSPWIDVGNWADRAGLQRGTRWRSWANWVSSHPWRVLLIAGAPLVFLAAHAANLRTDLPRGRWLPVTADSVRTLREIDSVARGNFGQIIAIILDLPEGTTIRDEAGWKATAKLVRHFARDSRVQHVWAVTTVAVKPMAGPELLAQIPATVLRSLISADGREVLIQLLPKSSLGAADAAAMARQIRAEDASNLTGLPGSRLQIGGVPAFNIDYEDAINQSLGYIAAIVVGATLLVLSISFRSLLIPLKAVVLNLLSVAASFGAVTLVFQEGYGSQLVGLAHPLEGGFPIVPVLVFGIVFGLSMDYEVFLVSRVAEGRRSGLGDTAALVEGVVSMGRVITFAAALMIIIFGAFVFGDFIVIKLLGFALGVAVFIDATIIRLAIGPALISLAGRWNWWPGIRTQRQKRQDG